MATAHCKICDAEYERGSYFTHLREAHPSQRLTRTQQRTLAGGRANARWTLEMAEEAALRFRGGQTLGQIGAHFGVTDGRISQILNRYHLTGGRPSPASRSTAELDELRVPSSKTIRARQQLVEKYGDQWSQVVRLRRAGKSLVKVATEAAVADTSG